MAEDPKAHKPQDHRPTETDQTASPDATEAGRIQQSDAPVDVPKTPGKPTSTTEDVASQESHPPQNPDDGSVWSDTELPAPNKKGVRTHLF